MNKQGYDRLASIVFRTDADGKPTYPGYRPEVRELPNGDGKVDADKRYAHVARKYLEQYLDSRDDYQSLEWAMIDAHMLALRIADALQVPEAFKPQLGYGTLRILEYPAGATSALHTDFDLFTLMIYRDQPECFVSHEPVAPDWGNVGCGYRLMQASKLNAQLHIGELGELIGLGPATPHEVIASDRPQHSIVYFAIPAHDAVLPTGQTVGEWLEERMSRSRTTYR
jgi:hypothetical protein